MVSIAALRHRITIRQPAIKADPIRGKPAVPAQTIATGYPAAIEPLDGRELYEAQQLSSVISHRVRMRYLAGLTATCEVFFGARTFEIIAVVNVEERNVEHRLLCQELA